MRFLTAATAFLLVCVAAVRTQVEWIERSPAPNARYAHGMAFDSARQVTVLYGGRWQTESYGDSRSGETELERLLQQSPNRPLEEALVAKVALHCVPGGYPIWRWRGAMSSLERDVAARPILAAFQRRIGTDKALPFGIAFGEETKMFPTGCGTSDDTDPEVGMPMIACGMGILRARSLKLLEVTGRQR